MDYTQVTLPDAPFSGSLSDDHAKAAPLIIILCESDLVLRLRYTPWLAALPDRATPPIRFERCGVLEAAEMPSPAPSNMAHSSCHGTVSKNRCHAGTVPAWCFPFLTHFAVGDATLTPPYSSPLWLEADAEWSHRSQLGQLDATHSPNVDLGSDVAAGAALATLSSLAQRILLLLLLHREHLFSTALFNTRHAAS